MQPERSLIIWYFLQLKKKNLKKILLKLSVTIIHFLLPIIFTFLFISETLLIFSIGKINLLPVRLYVPLIFKTEI